MIWPKHCHIVYPLHTKVSTWLHGIGTSMLAVGRGYHVIVMEELWAWTCQAIILMLRSKTSTFLHSLTLSLSCWATILHLEFIPSNIYIIFKLHCFGLSQNDISRDIPPSIIDIINLSYANFSYNNLGGIAKKAWRFRMPFGTMSATTSHYHFITI